jgi:hypothetical protein
MRLSIKGELGSGANKLLHATRETRAREQWRYVIEELT